MSFCDAFSIFVFSVRSWRHWRLNATCARGVIEAVKSFNLKPFNLLYLMNFVTFFLICIKNVSLFGASKVYICAIINLRFCRLWTTVDQTKNGQKQNYCFFVLEKTRTCYFIGAINLWRLELLSLSLIINLCDFVILRKTQISR